MRIVLGTNSAYFSDLLHSTLHATSRSVHSLEQGLIVHTQMANSRHHLCSTALSATKSGNDFKRRPITNLLSFPVRFSPDYDCRIQCIFH